MANIIFNVKCITNLKFAENKDNDKQNIFNLFLVILTIKANVKQKKYSNKG